MSVTQVSGLVSGLDTKSLIDAIVTSRSRPITLIQQRQAAKTSELAAWKSFEAVLVSLKISAGQLADASLWSGLRADTSDADHFTVDASAKAATGSWDLFVDELAVAHQVETQGYGSRDDLVGSGTLVLRTATGTRDIEVAEGTTLSDLANLVNEADAGVQATVVRSQAAGVESFRLVLTAAETGEANRFTVDATGLDGGVEPVFAERRAGADAVVHFGGADGTELRSSTNTFADLLDGVDVTVTKAHDTGEVTSLTIGRDTDGISTALSGFVESFNAMVEFANSQYKFDAESGTRPPLMGSATLTAMVSDIRNRVLGPVAGTEGAAYRTLGAVGLRSDGDGSLRLDDADFSAALEADFDAVAALFRVDAQSGSEGVKWVSSPDSLALGARTAHLEITQAATRATLAGSAIGVGAGITIDGTNDSFRITIDGTRSEVLYLAHGTYTDGDALAAAVRKAVDDSTTLGALAVNVSFQDEGSGTGHLLFTSPRYGSKGTLTLGSTGSSFAQALGLASVMNLNAKGVDVAGTIDGVEATGDGQRLVAPDGSGLAGTIFQVTLEDAGVPAVVDVSFTEGMGRLTARRLEALTDTNSGELRRLGDAIQSMLDRYNKDIETKQTSLEALRARLEAQYARLESTLSELQGQGNFVSAQLSAFQSSKSK